MIAIGCDHGGFGENIGVLCGGRKSLWLCRKGIQCVCNHAGVLQAVCFLCGVNRAARLHDASAGRVVASDLL